MQASGRVSVATGIGTQGQGHMTSFAQIVADQLGVPVEAGPLRGEDALLSTCMMPPGIPVATVAVGKPGAVNAGILAAQILAVSEPVLPLTALES